MYIQMPRFWWLSIKVLRSTKGTIFKKYIWCVLKVNLKKEANIYNISEFPELKKHEVKLYLYQAQSDFTSYTFIKG